MRAHLFNDINARPLQWRLSTRRKIFPGKADSTHFIIFIFSPLTELYLLSSTLMLDSV